MPESEPARSREKAGGGVSEPATYGPLVESHCSRCGYLLTGAAKQTVKTWRCFFCDEVFRSRGDAFAHFGEENCETDPPACVDPLRTDEKARFKELREARDFAVKCQNEALRAEELAEGLEAEHDNFFRYFGPDCRTMWQAADRYKNAVYELNLLRERLKQLEEKAGVAA
jgi:hypothetical protein